MDKKVFQELLAEEVKSYKALLETPDNDWIVKGFIDVNKNIYGINNMKIAAILNKNQSTLVCKKLTNYVMLPANMFREQKHEKK